MGAVNAFWIFILGPLIFALILNILSKTKCKEKKVFQDGWRYALGTFTYYGIFLVAYGQFASLGLNLRFFYSET